MILLRDSTVQAQETTSLEPDYIQEKQDAHFKTFVFGNGGSETRSATPESVSPTKTWNLEQQLSFKLLAPEILGHFFEWQFEVPSDGGRPFGWQFEVPSDDGHHDVPSDDGHPARMGTCNPWYTHENFLETRVLPMTRPPGATFQVNMITL